MTARVEPSESDQILVRDLPAGEFHPLQKHGPQVFSAASVSLDRDDIIFDSKILG